MNGMNVEKPTSKPREETMEKLSGLKISLCQMPVQPGNLERNADYIVDEIRSAAKRGVDIIVFTELGTTGYFIGDCFEDPYLLDDVSRCNKRIVKATSCGITAIFGTVLVSPGKKGEDGRVRKHNGAVVARGGAVIGTTIKSLQPNYRFFNDDKHFFSLRKVAEELSELSRASNGKEGKENCTIADLLNPFVIPTSVGDIKVGVILCEDMWHSDYAYNPTKILAQKGAELVVNLSASPWTWQKNRKRHSIVKNLLEECRVPFVYVNNCGAQNTGKNMIVFDGSSTVYNDKGDIVFEVQPYEEGGHDFIFKNPMYALPQRAADDTSELYAALVAATSAATPADATIVVGLSGGIDSAVSAAHFADVFGAGRVHAINMPFSNLNSKATQDFAKAIAESLGISYEVIPITEIVEATCKATGVLSGTLAYENVQARIRKEILAALAQKMGGVFSCNSNKVEMAFGYGTLYGDVAGYYAPLGDLVKREVRQIADYLNRVRFGREVIPEECIAQIPTAELAVNQKDPFDYGGLDRRGYHDEMVRAFTEFRRNPEWFLEMYIKGKLEEELMLDKGTLRKLFPTDNDFVIDLEKHWRAFQRAFFKRVQCPPLPIFSKRAFGSDFEESILPTHFTEQYRYLADRVIKSGKKSIAVYGGSFNPPGNHHLDIVLRLSCMFDKVLIVPCGNRKDKAANAVAANHRKEMARMAFSEIQNVEFDFYDLDNNVFTPTQAMAEKYSKLFPDTDLWFVVGVDIITGGRNNDSEIQRKWINGKEIWNELNFVVVDHAGSPANLKDLPPKSKLINFEVVLGRSTLIRERIARGENVSSALSESVVRYIKENKLYLA